MKFYLFIVLFFLIVSSQKTHAQNNFGSIKEPQKDKETKLRERIFIDYADTCLGVIEQSAQSLLIKGVAFIAFIPGDTTLSWISKIKVIGALTGGNVNYLAIACSKASEMASTLKNSGSGVRVPMVGEFGYKGGVIKKVSGGYILAVFSGGTSDQDVEVANNGLDLLGKYYIGLISK